MLLTDAQYLVGVHGTTCTCGSAV